VAQQVTEDGVLAVLAIGASASYRTHTGTPEQLRTLVSEEPLKWQGVVEEAMLHVD
jgi:hypothetical protein